VSYTLSKAQDDTVVSSLSDHYGYVKVQRPGAADRRHRLAVSGIVELPAQLQPSAIGDFRSSLPFGPVTPGLDLKNDTQFGTTTTTGDPPPGVSPPAGCRSPT